MRSSQGKVTLAAIFVLVFTTDWHSIRRADCL